MCVICVATKSAAPTIPCAHPWIQFNSSCYYISSFSDSWEDGQHFCQEMDGHLAIIHTPEEQVGRMDAGRRRRQGRKER